MIKKVCVYCASSTQISEVYKNEARRLGELLSENNIACVYGGGSVGLMGELSKSMVDNGGNITGIIPQFMVDEGWDNNFVEEIVVGSMHERKALMVKDVDAAIALPGGCGTLEELLEVITWKQLGLFTKPVVILNINGFFDPLLDMLNKAVDEKFMRLEHKQIWCVANRADDVLDAINSAAEWSESARGFAAM